MLTATLLWFWQTTRKTYNFTASLSGLAVGKKPYSFIRETRENRTIWIRSRRKTLEAKTKRKSLKEEAKWTVQSSHEAQRLCENRISFREKTSRWCSSVSCIRRLSFAFILKNIGELTSNWYLLSFGKENVSILLWLSWCGMQGLNRTRYTENYITVYKEHGQCVLGTRVLQTQTVNIVFFWNRLSLCRSH